LEMFIAHSSAASAATTAKSPKEVYAPHAGRTPIERQLNGVGKSSNRGKRL